ncbi:MAG: N(4)-(beta-N-acetylglucosaminyl)-L-asparaginase [Bacteroidetes bacterium]|nr:N(4)-(beta-N-acetylglucosaminyl)-L-asparaginase [Bacteroidota bacterium]
MLNRRKFISGSALGSVGLLLGKEVHSASIQGAPDSPIVVSTWDVGLDANRAAWEVLSRGGIALDAVEQGVRITEDSLNCCVGLGGNPDRDGFVTLDACIMDAHGNCGSVAFLERIKHPISVARRVMEKTPHVMLVGIGAQQFALEEGFKLESGTLSEDAQRAYEQWLEKSNYRPPEKNIENKKQHGPFAPTRLANGDWNHDTIGMLALDQQRNLSGSCTTSGAGFKMRGRVGDSPLIGSGLYVDNEVGACTATGQGEEIIRIAGAHLVVEFMRSGLTPEQSCKKAIERFVKLRTNKLAELQVCFLAIDRAGNFGGYSLRPGFTYAVRSRHEEKIYKSTSWFDS